MYVWCIGTVWKACKGRNVSVMAPAVRPTYRHVASHSDPPSRDSWRCSPPRAALQRAGVLGEWGGPRERMYRYHERLLAQESVSPDSGDIYGAGYLDGSARSGFPYPPDLCSATQQKKEFINRHPIKEKHVGNNLTVSIFYLEVLWSCYQVSK